VSQNDEVCLVRVRTAVNMGCPRRHTELGTITISLSASFKPSRCFNPQAHLAACSRSPPYVRLLFAIVSMWTTLSAGQRSGLYFVINCGMVILSSKPTGQKGPLIADEDIVINDDRTYVVLDRIQAYEILRCRFESHIPAVIKESRYKQVENTSPLALRSSEALIESIRMLIRCSVTAVGSH
jgi:hypothetical protein